jgi:hypothetical protein
MRLQVGWLALPPGGAEEHADACLAFRVAVVHDMPEDQVGRIDQDARLLTCFADHALDHGLARLQVPRRRSAWVRKISRGILQEPARRREMRTCWTCCSLSVRKAQACTGWLLARWLLLAVFVPAGTC